MKILLDAQETVDLVAWALTLADKLPKGYVVDSLRVDNYGCFVKLKPEDT